MRARRARREHVVGTVVDALRLPVVEQVAPTFGLRGRYAAGRRDANDRVGHDHVRRVEPADADRPAGRERRGVRRAALPAAVGEVHVVRRRDEPFRDAVQLGAPRDGARLRRREERGAPVDERGGLPRPRTGALEHPGVAEQPQGVPVRQRHADAAVARDGPRARLVRRQERRRPDDRFGRLRRLRHRP